MSPPADDEPLPAAELLAAIDRHLAARAGARHPVVAYWYRVAGSRTEYLDRLRAAGRSAVVPLPVTDRFQNSNALMTDLRWLLTEHRAEFERVPAPTPDQPLVLVLLGRTELGVPQTPSPALMPDWFPGLGGRVEQIGILDLTWKAEVPIDHPAARVPELHLRVYELDRALTRRLAAVSAVAPARPAALLDRFRQAAGAWNPAAGETPAGWLAAAVRKLDAVPDAGSYRLKLDEPAAPTPLAAVVRVTTKTPPDEVLKKVAPEFAAGVAVPAPLPPVRQSFLADITCFTARDAKATPDVQFGLNLFRAVHAAHRFSTVSHHPQDYPTYPVALLRSASLDLRAALEVAATALLVWPLPPN